MPEFPVKLNPNEPIVLYGIGPKTGEIIKKFPEINIAGLMDNTHTGAVFFGKRVLSESEIIGAGIRKIIIVARRSNIKIIYRRIADFCDKNNIAVFDILGGSYPEKEDFFDVSRFAKYNEITRENLQKKIEAADTVSFDIFDTLLVRTVLFPTDVFERFGDEFAKARIAAERDFYSTRQFPGIYEIYEKLRSFPVSAIDEIAAEKSVLLPRKEVVDFLDFAKKCGKKIYLTSDMYFPKNIMRDILLGCGIDIPEGDILVSCDYNKSKETGLFEVLREKAKTGKILHIGDSYEGDILSAKRYGIDDTFFIPSTAEMLEDSYARDLLKHTKTFSERGIIGKFTANALRDPFLFSETSGKFRIASIDEMGYIFLAPIVWVSFCEMIKIAEEKHINTILLGARDGFLFSEIYKKLSDKIEMPKMHYFLVSRALAVFAAIKNENDIKEAMNLPWSGNAEDLLKTRFNIITPKKRIKSESDTEYVLRHSAEILGLSKKTRSRYLDYIKKFDIKENEKIGFFDLVSSGTCQKAVTAITDFDLLGIYIIGLLHNNGYKSEVPVKSVFGTVDPYKKSYHLLDNYLLLENVLLSGDPTIADFDESGNPIFISDERTKSQIDNLFVLQKNIIKYCQNIGFSITDTALSDKNIPDIIYNCLKSENCEDKTGYFNTEKMFDEFTNRTFGV